MFAGIAGGRERREHSGRFDRDFGVSQRLDDRVAGGLITFVAFLFRNCANLIDCGL